MTNRAPEELIPSLVHEDPLVRSYTARLLGLDAEAGEVEQYLKSSLVQGTAPLRRAAARAMGELVADWALEPLSAALDDADPAVRAEAAASLGRLGDATAVPELIALLSDPAPGVQAEVLGFAGRIGRCPSDPSPGACPAIPRRRHPPQGRRRPGGHGRSSIGLRPAASPGRSGQWNPGHRGGSPGPVVGSGSHGGSGSGAARIAGGDAGGDLPGAGAAAGRQRSAGADQVAGGLANQSPVGGGPGFGRDRGSQRGGRPVPDAG